MNLIDTYLEYVKPYKGSVRYHEAVALSLISAMVEKRVWYPKGDMRLYLNQYIFLVGGPGMGKTFSADLATDQIRKYNISLGPGNGGIKFGPNKATPAAFLKNLKRLQKTIKSEQYPPFEQSAMFLYTRELSSIIKDIGGGSFADDLLDLYDVGDQDYVKELVGDGQIKLVRPHLNILACTTPTFLSGFMPREQSGTGLTARVMFINELEMPQKSYDEVKLSKELSNQIQFEFSRLHRTVGPVKRSHDTNAYLKECDKAAMQTLREGLLSSHLQNFYARKNEHIIKLGSCFMLAESSNMILKVEHLERAKEFIERQEETIHLAFGVSDIKRTQEASKIIFDAIPRDNPITQADLYKKLFANGLAGASREFEDLIGFLHNANMIEATNINGVRWFKRIG